MVTNYPKAVMYMLAYAITSVFNDSIMKLINLPAQQMVFCRFGIGAVILLGLLFYYRVKIFTPNFKIHMLSGLIMSIAMSFYAKSLQLMPLSLNIIGTFAVPILVTAMAWLFLDEKIKDSVFNTLLGFAGVVVAFAGQSGLGYTVWPLAIAVTLFSTLDIINKVLLKKSEPTLVIMFYVALYTSLFSSVGAVSTWQPVTTLQGLGLLWMGIGGNMVLFFLLRSFSYASIALTQPFKYSELPLSFAAGYLIFGDRIDIYSIIGSVLICCSVLQLWYSKMSKRL